MKKLLRSKLFLILSGPVMGAIGLWTAVALSTETGKPGVPFILLIAGLFITAVNAGWHIFNKNISLKP